MMGLPLGMCTIAWESYTLLVSRVNPMLLWRPKTARLRYHARQHSRQRIRSRSPAEAAPMQTTRPLTLLLRCGAVALLALAVIAALGTMGTLDAGASPAPSTHAATRAAPAIAAPTVTEPEVVRADYHPWLIFILIVFA